MAGIAWLEANGYAESAATIREQIILKLAAMQNYYLSHLQQVLLFFKGYLIDLYWCVTMLLLCVFIMFPGERK